MKKRSEVASADKWRLEDIYPEDILWESDFAKAKEKAGELAGFKGKLGRSGQALLEALTARDSLSRLLDKLVVYARMRKDEDTTNPVYQALTDRVLSLSVAVDSATAYFVPELLAIPAETLARFQTETPGLAPYRHYLEDLTRQKDHILTETEEKLLAEAGELAQAPVSIFGMLNNADIRFGKVKDEQGEEIELTKGRYLQLMESADRRVRQDAFSTLYSSYRGLQHTLAASLNASVKKDVFFARVRRYKSALEAALDDDNISVQVYDSLISTVRAHLKPMYRYVALRRRVLGLKELHMFDLYTPLVQEARKDIPYADALEGVTKGLAPLGETYLGDLRAGLSGGWIDVYENEGKTGGAYSWGSYDTHPYVLLNYQGTLNDTFTIAHEMGHALHSFYSNREQPYISAHYKIFLAEVASTFNESLLIDYLLANTTDPQEKMFMLNHYLEQFRGTVYRQTMFAEFEKIIHEKVEAGEALTPDVLNKVYLALNRDYYGPEMNIDQEIAVEWGRIPHFYTPFYVYKYATGFSAATALARQVLDEGAPAVERYRKFLAGGNSAYPLELLKKAGVDMTTPQPVEAALRVFEKLVGEMEKITERIFPDNAE